jgi:GNAT superfamily N-acetyltransferase
MLDDPSAAPIRRPAAQLGPSLPPALKPRTVVLRDGATEATIVPFRSVEQVPPSLLKFLSDEFNAEIEAGDTYPMTDTLPVDRFGAYWLQNFAAIMLLGRIESAADVVEGKDWTKECMGSYYIKPNYPGRSSHICNAGFLVTTAARGKGVGRLLGESYIRWAPHLGYRYSVFNLVYETNEASTRIWDQLGFQRIGRVPECGDLKSFPGRLVDAIVYGRKLSVEEWAAEDTEA